MWTYSSPPTTRPAGCPTPVPTGTDTQWMACSSVVVDELLTIVTLFPTVKIEPEL